MYFEIGKDVNTTLGRGTITGIDNTHDYCIVLIDSDNKEHELPFSNIFKLTEDSHPKKSVILHWVNGGKIQYRTRESAMKFYSEDWRDWIYGFSMTPQFSSENVEYRIKPNMVTRKFRVGMTKGRELRIYFEEPIQPFGIDQFSHWISPEWVTFEVEA